MKWFKHDTDARNDIKIKLLKQRHGAEGYGVYFQLVEIIGDNFDTNNTKEWGFVESSHTIETLAIECGVSPDKLRTILQTCDEIGLFSQKKGKLYCKSIKKRIDEYTRKAQKSSSEVSGHTTDNVPTVSGKKRTDKKRKEKTRVRADVSLIEKNAPSLGKRYREVLAGKTL